MEGNDNVNLENLLNKEITVHLKGGKKLTGTLTKYDDYMNLVLKKAKEQKQDDTVKEYNLVIVKGGNTRAITF
ncbi:hypothetical protein AKJ37_00400 [candidate division MSBL1 archaeon SCGC-AAA259I09]|uniref:Sm domain-containing protein n=3 Tax=candidate division MSBL1 TaxID=215777 RepID=A0A133USQ6_9EURY|nr:hypothetical protein AKJ36_01065 [candidate division MSBL1 archaeon SCGC-AAA259I07]KXA97274.1 hypothetical protein AKJ38_01570 [candidate division MSBL1 archaeon SCGC-AAA259I14]KXA98361.1 hypothetical protein AKJ37_00400 [candidate division MSBL1 archaeon SCGC-AAA259I09]